MDCISESNEIQLIFSFRDAIFYLLFKLKIKKLMQYTWLKQLRKTETYTVFSFTCRSVNCIQDNWYNNNMKWTQNVYNK